MNKKLVIALGGNALGNNAEEQIKAVEHTAISIADLIEEGNQVILSHGNGPQVGLINSAFDNSANSEAKTPAMPFPECGAMSQGYIGYHLQNALKNELDRRNINKGVVTIVSEVLFNKEDPAFQNPTKPIGRFYKESEKDELLAKGYDVKEDAGRGYRRVVPSPKPLEIIQIDSIRTLVDNDFVVIAAGGGGVPVIKTENGLEGIAAVIDKDFTTAKLAEQLDADILIVLTAVEKVAIRYNTPEVEWLDELSAEEARKHIANHEFAAGSMLPKMQAALTFIESKKGRKALITSLEKAREALDGKTGTWIM